MKQVFVIKRGNERLTILFAGWGMDERPFLQYEPINSDFMVCYDYRTLEFEVSRLMNYAVIDVIGWSMGVWASSQVLSHSIVLPIRKTIAINGTVYPVDEERGIPPSVFQGTLDGLDEASLLKFRRRMCANGDAFKRFQQIAPQRPVEELKDELAAIAQHYQMLPMVNFCWERAFIGDNDRIFPSTNQYTAWKETSTIIENGKETHYDEQLFRKYLEERNSRKKYE